MGKTYRLRLVDKQDGPLVCTDGDLNAIAYHLRNVELAPDSEYSVGFQETDGIDGGPVRVVSEVTADGEVVGLVLKKKLKQERAAEQVLTHDGDTLDRVE